MNKKVFRRIKEIMLTKIKNELIYLSTLRRILSSLKSINNDENSIITKKLLVMQINHLIL